MKKLALVLFFIGIVSLTSAEAQKSNEKQDKEFSGSAELSYIVNTGNTDSESFGTGVDLEYRLFSWEHSFKGNYFRLATNDVTETRLLKLDLKSTKDLSERFSLLAQLGYFTNKFAGIDSRYSFDFGPSYKIIDNDEHLLRTNLVGGYVEEDRINRKDLSFISGKANLFYSWSFSKLSRLSNDFTYIHNFEDSNDWRIQNESALVTKMSDLLSLKISYLILTLNDPVAGFEKTDTITSVAVVGSF